MSKMISLRKNKIENFLICLAIILLPFGDSRLSETSLGFFGYFLSSFPLLLLLFFKVIKRGLNLKINIGLFFVITHFLAACLFTLIVWGDQFRGESLFFKGLKMMLLFLIPLCLLKSNYHKTSVTKSFLVSYAIAVVGLYFFSGNELIHATPNGIGRPRGFSQESSHFAQTIGGITFCLLVLMNNKKAKLLVAITTFACMYYSGSKAGVVFYTLALALYITFMAFRSNSISNRAILVACMFVLCVTSLFTLPKVYAQLQADIEKYTSFATRSTGITTALVAATQAPLGYGFSGFTPAFVENISTAIEINKNIFGDLSFEEIKSYQAGKTLKSISSKSYLFDLIVVFGFAFLFVFSGFNAFLMLKEKDPAAKAGCFFVLMTLTVWSTGLGMYVLFMVYGVILDRRRILL